MKLRQNEPLSKEFLAQRGKCCGNRCLNCPFDPRWKKNSTKIKKGFTLIEIIIVLTIIVAVLAIATPNVLKQLERSKKKHFEHTIQKAIEDAKYVATTRGEPMCIVVVGEQIKTIKIKHFVGQEFDRAFFILKKKRTTLEKIAAKISDSGVRIQLVSPEGEVEEYGSF